MREHDLQPPRRRRFIATTQSAHNLPVFPNLAREMVPDDPNRLWSGEITDVTVASGFVDVALVLDAWSRAWSAMRSVGRPTRRSPWPCSQRRLPRDDRRSGASATPTADPRTPRQRYRGICWRSSLSATTR